MKEIRIRPKKKRYVIGTGYPWYGNAYTDFGTMQQTTHGLGSIKLYDNPITGQKGSKASNVIMLDPKATYNGKKYKLILEEI
jgi:hypothetical protein